ncbi:hypothetical protein GPALN_014385 [Globodera pallida]|nr:hypothetical protein GPALN_014385 [Globodera pallida]
MPSKERQKRGQRQKRAGKLSEELENTPSSLMTNLNLSDTPRTSRSCNDSSAEPPCKRTRAESAQQSAFVQSFEDATASSQNASPNLLVDTPKKIQRSGGRPKKKSGGPGRPKKFIANSASPQIPDQINANEVGAQPIENVIMNNSADILPINLYSMNTLELPIGPAIAQHGRIAPAQLLANRDEIQRVWADESEFCADYMIFAFQRWLASKIQDKHVAVLEPFFTQNIGPDTLGLDPHDFCFNYSENYDILLITVMYPAHFTLLIFDRTSQPPKCIFVDPLPPVLNEHCPFDDRLYDIRYPGYDQNRLRMLSETICRLTPGIQPTDFCIRIVRPDEFTFQRDGINCGFFVALYSESYLTKNCSLLLPDLNIGVERRRILWILSKLLLTNDVPYVPREYSITEEVQHTPIHVRAVRASVLSSTPLRRSPRLSILSTTRETSIERNAAQTDKTVSPITRRCHQRHSGYVCTDVRAKHAPEYYDSGNLGDKKCDFCSAILFESEAKVKHGKTSSFNCCNFGAIQLPPIEQPPPLLKRLSTQDSAEAKEYRAHQNAYNSLLAFASISVGHKENTADGAVCFMLTENLFAA